MTKPPEARLSFVEEDNDLVLYCGIKEGRRFKRIAKRHSGKNWISLEPGYVVRGSEPGGNYDHIKVEYNPTGASVQ